MLDECQIACRSVFVAWLLGQDVARRPLPKAWKWIVQGDTCTDKAKDFIGKGRRGGEQERKGTQENCSATWLTVLGFTLRGLVLGLSLTILFGPYLVWLKFLPDGETGWEGGRAPPLREWHSLRTQHKLIRAKEVQDGEPVNFHKTLSLSLLIVTHQPSKWHTHQRHNNSEASHQRPKSRL